MQSEVRVLYVSDAADTVSPDGEKIGRADEQITVVTAHSVDDALDQIVADTFDCVLSAYQLPDGDGIVLLRRIRESDPDLPVVLYAARGTERVASEAISAGVTDYIRNDPAVDQTETVTSRIREIADQQPRESGGGEATETAQSVFWLLSAEWDEVIAVSSAHSTVWGQSEATFRAEPLSFLDAVHPDDRPRAREAVDRLEAGDSVETELRVGPSAEFQRDVLLQAEPIPGRDGSASRIAAVSHTRTSNRAQRRQLREEEQLTESIFKAIPDVLYTFDTEGYLLRWNDQLEAETGYSGSEIAGMYVTDFVPAEEIENIASSFQAIIEEGRTVTVESAFETKGGARVPFEFTGAPLRDADGELYGVTGVGRNIAEKRQRQRRFEAVFNNTYQFTGLMSTDGTLLEVNSAAVRFAGRSREELVGQQLWEAYWFQTSEDAAQVAREAVETASEGEFFREEITVQGQEREAVIDFSVRPITDEDGAVELLVPEGRDITRLSQREQQLEVTNRFLRHNIRNKLTTIQGYAEFISGTDDTTLQSYGDTIAQAATELNRNAELARQIHALITDAPTPEPVELTGQLERAISTVREQQPHAAVTLDAPESLEVTGLESLHDAFDELLAIVLADAPAERPELEVSVSRDDDAIVELTPVEGRLSSAEQDVLSGDIDVKQTRHAGALGVWYVYWTVWYSGGAITVTENGNRLRVRFPTA